MYDVRGEKIKESAITSHSLKLVLTAMTYGYRWWNFNICWMYENAPKTVTFVPAPLLFWGILWSSIEERVCDQSPLYSVYTQRRSKQEHPTPVLNMPNHYWYINSTFTPRSLHLHSTFTPPSLHLHSTFTPPSLHLHSTVIQSDNRYSEGVCRKGNANT